MTERIAQIYTIRNANKKPVNEKACRMWQRGLTYETKMTKGKKKKEIAATLLIKHNRLTVFTPLPLLDQWYFFSLWRGRNEKITEISAASLSWHIFTRLLLAGSLCSSSLARNSSLARVTLRRACSQANLLRALVTYEFPLPVGRSHH